MSPASGTIAPAAVTKVASSWFVPKSTASETGTRTSSHDRRGFGTTGAYPVGRGLPPASPMTVPSAWPCALRAVRRFGRGRVRPRQRLLEHVPRQHGALDADRVLDDALQGHQVAELLLGRLNLPGHHPPEVGSQRLRVLHGL